MEGSRGGIKGFSPNKVIGSICSPLRFLLGLGLWATGCRSEGAAGVGATGAGEMGVSVSGR